MGRTFCNEAMMRFLFIFLAFVPHFTQGASIEEIEEGLENVLLNIGEGIGDVVDELDKQMECKEQGEECNGAPACCDSLVCQRDIQWNPFTTGSCVLCVEEGSDCQLDSQCCGSGNLICDRDMVTEFSGRCHAPRRKGDTCHRDGQCSSGECDKRWYELYGDCK